MKVDRPPYMPPCCFSPSELVGETKLVLNVKDQKLYELNSLAAFLWQAVEDGLSSSEILEEMLEHGLPRDSASALLARAWREWASLGISPLRVPPGTWQTGNRVKQRINLAGLTAEIAYDGRLYKKAAPVFAHLESELSRDPDLRLETVLTGDVVHLFKDGAPLTCCLRPALPTVIKAELFDAALASRPADLAVHAASLVVGDDLLLLAGRSGGGKSTLTLALNAAGLPLAGDDIAFLRPDGVFEGIPFAPGIKPGSWSMAREFLPDIFSLPVFVRPDRRRVRYVSPPNMIRPSPRKAAFLILLDRKTQRVPASMQPMSPGMALRTLVSEALSASKELDQATFSALAKATGRLQAFTLTYSDLSDAVSTVLQTMESRSSRRGGSE